jgi:hypothetical protein
MRKSKTRSKQKDNEPGLRRMFYCQKKCFACGKLIWGSSPKNHRLASKDCYFKMKAHHQDCQTNQLNLSLPGREGKQSQAIEKVSLRGEEK